MITKTEELVWGQLYDEEKPELGKHYPVHQYQQAILDSNSRFTAAVAGTGGGKTVGGALWAAKFTSELIEKALKAGRKPNILGFIVAPTYKILSRATVPLFRDTLEHTALGEAAGARYLESTNKYILPNNWGNIWCQGADNAHGLEGGQFDWVWADEGGQLGTKAFRALEGRTGAKESPFLVTTTPYITSEGFGPLHKEWYPRFKSGDKNYNIIQFGSIENPTYSRDEFERAKRELPPEVFKSRYLGLFTAVEGLVYPNFHKTEVDIGPKALQNLIKLSLQYGFRFVGGIDFGWVDPFAAVGGILLSANLMLTKDGKWHQIEDIREIPFDHIDEVQYLFPVGSIICFYERYKTKTVMTEHIRYLPDPETYPFTWYCDHNPEQIRLLRIAGFRARRAPKYVRGLSKFPIQNRIILTHQRIETSRLYIIKTRCPALFGEAELYAYPEKDEEIHGETPIDSYNHAMDGLGYLICGIDHKIGVAA